MSAGLGTSTPTHAGLCYLSASFFARSLFFLRTAPARRTARSTAPAYYRCLQVPFPDGELCVSSNRFRKLVPSSIFRPVPLPTLIHLELFSKLAPISLPFWRRQRLVEDSGQCNLLLARHCRYGRCSSSSSSCSSRLVCPQFLLERLPFVDPFSWSRGFCCPFADGRVSHLYAKICAVFSFAQLLNALVISSICLFSFSRRMSAAFPRRFLGRPFSSTTARPFSNATSFEIVCSARWNLKQQQVASASSCDPALRAGYRSQLCSPLQEICRLLLEVCGAQHSLDSWPSPSILLRHTITMPRSSELYKSGRRFGFVLIIFRTRAC